MNAKTFRLVFKRLRSELNITQKDIASDLGVSSSAVAMWETGQRLPSPELYEQIADYFNVDIDYLYGRTDIRRRISFDADGNTQFALDPDQEQLLSYFDQLNSDGKTAALERVRELTELKKFKQDTASSESKMA